MNHPKLITLLKLTGKRLTMMLLLGISAVSFATLGDGKVRTTDRSKGSLLSSKSTARTGSFNLRSGYTYRGNEVINTNSKRYVQLNTVVTMQRGNTTYIVPLKKNVILDGKVKLEFGNRQLRRN